MKRKYIVCSPSFQKNIGGIIVLHKLCDLLNKSGCEAYVWPLDNNLQDYRVSENYQTPVASREQLKDSIVIYPEIVKGNPLNADHVVRWLLNTPGVVGGDGIFQKRDMIFNFSNIFADPTKKKANYLELVELFTNVFYDKGQRRAGSCYVRRKGRNRDIVHDTSDSFEITDSTPSDALADIFNKAKYFYSYDDATLLSAQAAMCGCISIVIPKAGVDPKTWHRSCPTRKYGIAYGLEEIDYAASTMSTVTRHLQSFEEMSQLMVQEFIHRTQTCAEHNIGMDEYDNSFIDFDGLIRQAKIQIYYYNLLYAKSLLNRARELDPGNQGLRGAESSFEAARLEISNGLRCDDVANAVTYGDMYDVLVLETLRLMDKGIQKQVLNQYMSTELSRPSDKLSCLYFCLTDERVGSQGGPAFIPLRLEKLEKSEDYILFKAERYIEAGLLAEAKELLEDLLNRFPENTNAMNDLAVIHSVHGELEKATELLGRLIEVDNSNLIAWKNLGKLNLGLNRLDHGLHAYHKALEISPSDRESILSLAEIYRSTKRNEQAIVYYEKLLKLDSKEGVGPFADQLIHRLRPRTIIEFGCADGPLIQALTDRGVKAFGLDSSSEAISRVRPDLRPFCEVGNAASFKSSGRHFDLAFFKEDIGPFSAEETELAVSTLCSISDEVLFSPVERGGPHDDCQNGEHPRNFWISAFERHGFVYREDTDVTFASKEALLFRRKEALRITIISPTSELSGGVRVLYQHAGLLAESGHIVTIASLDKRKPSWFSLPESVRFVPLTPKVVEIGEELPDGDILVATFWTTAYPVALAPASKGKKFYLVQHYESMWAGEPDTVEDSYSELPLTKVVVSSWIKDILRTELGEDSIVVLNGCDYAGRVVSKKNPSTSSLRVGMLYHTLKWKGVVDGVAAFNQMRKRFPEAELVLYGTRKPNVLPEGCVEFHENPDREELARMLESLDVFVSPSVVEGFGLPALEAMACGVPVVLTDSGGSRDYAEANVTALVSSPQDPAALAANLIRIAGDDGLRRQIGEAGKRKADEFTWKRASSVLEGAFRNSAAAQTRKLKILFVSAGYRWADVYLDPFIVRAFESLGHDVQTFFPRPQDWMWSDLFFTPSLLDAGLMERYVNKYGQPPEELVSVAKSAKPDLVFFNHALMIPDEVLDRLRKLGVPTAVWMIDEPQEMQMSAVRGRLFDYVFLQDKASLAFHLGGGNQHSYFLPHGFDPVVHRRLPNLDVLSQDEKSDVLIIGTGFEGRRKVVEALSKLDRDILVVGRGWEGMEFNKVRVRNTPVNFEEAARLYQGARITINVHRSHTDFTDSKGIPAPLSPNGSFFYIAACGSFQLIDSGFRGADEFLTPGKHYETFNDNSHLLELVEHCLTDDAYRIKAVTDAHDAVSRYHTYADRFRNALEVITPARTHRRRFSVSPRPETGKGVLDVKKAVPILSVIVAATGEPDKLKNSLSSLKASVVDPFDIVVVHTKNEQLSTWLDQSKVPHIESGFAVDITSQYDKGIPCTQGEYILFMTDDVVATPNFVRRLGNILEQNEAVGVIAPAFNSSGNGQVVNAMYSEVQGLHESARELYMKFKGQIQHTSTVDQTCFMIRRKALSTVGSFGSSADGHPVPVNDFFERVKKSGQEIAWTRSVFVHLQTPVNLPQHDEISEIKIAERRKSVNAKPKTLPEGQLASIVILTYNQLDYTKLTIDSIRKHTKTPYEIIVVDNASSDGTPEYLGTQKDIRVILNGENLGFPAGCNQGMEIAKGDYVVLLNNDVIVPDNWLEGLIECAESSREIGIVGPMSNRISGFQLEKNVTYRKVSQVHEFAAKYRRTNRKRWSESPRVAGFCMLIKREVLTTIGGLDVTFGIGNCEDDDYCVRAQLAGYKIVIAGDVFIHHFGSKSFGKDGWERYKEFIKVNELVFKEKWGVTPLEWWREGKTLTKTSELRMPFAVREPVVAEALR